MIDRPIALNVGDSAKGAAAAPEPTADRSALHRSFEWLVTHWLLLLTAVAPIAVVLCLPNALFVDEYAHWPQAQRYARGDWFLDPWISTWPTMNLIVGFAVRWMHQTDHVLAGRMVIAAFGIAGVFAFWRLVRHFDAASARMRTAQFFLSPVVLPFCGLVYTDIPALSALLWSALGAVRGNFWVMGTAAALACALRQNDVVWIGAIFGVFVLLRHRAALRVRAYEWLGMAIVIAGWCAAVKITGGIASAGTRGDHPGGVPGVPNLWFALAVAAIIYFPFFVARLFAKGAPVRLWQVLAVGLAVSFSFHVNHRFNLIETEYFVRNHLLHETFQGYGFALLVLTATTMAILLWRMPLVEPGWRLPLLGLCVISLVPFWLIEQRYYLPGFAFFWALRAPASRGIERTQLVFGAACTIWMVTKIAQGVHFV